jgi:hypothetical protein
MTAANQHFNASHWQGGFQLELSNGVSGSFQRGKRIRLGPCPTIVAIGRHVKNNGGLGLLLESNSSGAWISRRQTGASAFNFLDAFLRLPSVMGGGVCHRSQFAKGDPRRFVSPGPKMLIGLR